MIRHLVSLACSYVGRCCVYLYVLYVCAVKNLYWVTVCMEIFAVLNFRGFRGMPGHPRNFNLRIMVLAITTYNKMAAYFRRTVHVAKHDYNRTKDNRFCVSLNKALTQDTSIFVHPKFRKRSA